MRQTGCRAAIRWKSTSASAESRVLTLLERPIPDVAIPDQRLPHFGAVMVLEPQGSRFAGMSVAGSVRRALNGHVILHQHAILKDSERPGRGHFAIRAAFRSVKNNVVRLPLLRRAADVDQGSVLAV